MITTLLPDQIIFILDFYHSCCERTFLYERSNLTGDNAQLETEIASPETVCNGNNYELCQPTMRITVSFTQVPHQVSIPGQ